MRVSARLSLILLGVGLLAASCTDSRSLTTTGATTTTAAKVEAEFGLDLSPDQIEAVVLNGVNGTGRTDLGRDDWLRIARRVCDEGAWTGDVQRAIVTEEELDRRVPASDAMVVLLQIGMAACPELRPNG